MSLRAENVTYRYPGATRAAVGQVCLTVAPGSITALVGPSGAGKSTLARLLVGLLAPHSGAVTRDGQPVTARRGRLDPATALLAQDPLSAADPHHTLAEMIALPARLTSRQLDVHAAAAEVGLTLDLLHRRPREVSGGQLQRACLARALAQHPDYLIADEATAHLDPATTATIAAVLRTRADLGLGVLLITHDHALADAIADHRIEMPTAQ
ncbi:ABC transporter ATP-binding protein [Dietzia sp. 179-F 9C3 NHS]|uniref:ABC transporter ATP-binding protein n=1 Tax=Dietzia sp. 179-F 9C3 NHS TaxID=3374295 RepID=UPI00387A1730